MSASSLKRLCDLPGDSLGEIHVPAVVKVWQMKSGSSLACRKHFLCEQNMGPKAAYHKDEKQRNVLSVRKWQKEKSPFWQDV